MILELDCGNTRIKWRLRCGKEISLRSSFLTSESFDQINIPEVLRSQIKRVLVSSVLDDDYRRKIVGWSLAYLSLNPEFAHTEYTCAGVINGYQQPEKLGVDRWLNILAARAQTGAGCVVVDCGSAITVDVITAQGEHLGGYIAPGLRLMRESLSSKTSAINLGKIGYSESVFPGRNTVAAIKSAELAMITGLIVQAKAILSNYEAGESTLWITGGDGEWLSSMLNSSKYVEDLVLDGLSIALAVLDH